MLGALKSKLLSLLNSGHERSVRAKKNILAALFFKGGNILIGFVIVPITLHYLDKVQYGIWLTVTSILMYFQFFDIGLGNGMRNKFAQSKAKGEHELVKTYVSTTYASMGIIMSVVAVIFLLVHSFIPWDKVFNAPASLAAELSKVTLAVILLFFLRFFLQLLGKILMADQRPAFNNVFKFLGNALALAGIFTLTRTTDGSLFLVSLVFSLSPIVVLSVASLYFFNKDYKAYRPSISHVNMKYFPDLIGLGSRFFIIQMAAIVLFATDSMIIAQFFGPEEVTPYNIAHKYFNMIPILFGMVVTPLWSAITEAYTKGEFDWIKRTINKSIKLWLVLVGVVAFMLLISDWFYGVWLRTDEVKVPFLLSSVMAVYVLMFSFNSIFVMFINGTGKLKLQIYTAIFSIVANIPLSYLFGVKMGLGLTGVIMATSVSIIVSLILRPIQYYKVINGKATGIWNE
ncbi:MAG: oligosaccharide flippase family protein [Bacteroidota bacterium]